MHTYTHVTLLHKILATGLHRLHVTAKFVISVYLPQPDNICNQSSNECHLFWSFIK